MESIKIANTKIRKYVWNYVNSNAYVINIGTDALIIDPVDTEEFWQYIDDNNIKKASVFLTHEHFDHICGLNQLREKVYCTVYAHIDCSQNISQISRNMSNVANIISKFNGTAPENNKLLHPFTCAPADEIFDDKTEFRWNDFEILLRSTPGHSLGSACMIFNNMILFSGDTLLGVPTITRFPGGDLKQFRNITLPWLYDLCGQIQCVFPGHGNSGTIECMLKKQTINKKR